MNAYDGPPLKGAMMAIDDINAKGGILGKQIRAVVSDTKTDTVQGAKAAAQVIAEGAQFMGVSCDYDMGAPAATVANDNKIIAIAFCASDAKMGVQGIGPYAFTLEIYGQGEGAVGAAYAWKRGWRKAYGLLDASNEYDKSICDGFLEYWREARRRGGGRRYLHAGRRLDRLADHPLQAGGGRQAASPRS